MTREQVQTMISENMAVGRTEIPGRAERDAKGDGYFVCSFICFIFVIGEN